jgi:hypothetical protein
VFWFLKLKAKFYLKKRPRSFAKKLGQQKRSSPSILVLGESPKLSAQLNLAGLIFSSAQNSPATFLFFLAQLKISSAKN